MVVEDTNQPCEITAILEELGITSHLVSFKLPSAESWKDAFAGLKPDELKLAVGPEPVAATWRFKKD